MADLHTVIKAIDFIEAHLREPIGVGDIADAVSYSLYYFSRLFHRVAHHTPYDYLIRRRIAEAARDLSNGDRTIIDIAFEYQFNSHETFTRAFRRAMHTTPSVWRKTHQDHFAPMPCLTEAHLHALPMLKDSVEIKTIDTKTLTGISELCANTASSQHLWTWLNQELGDSPDKGTYEIVYYNHGKPAMWLLAVPSSNTIPESARLVKHTLPHNTYACCSYHHTQCDLPLLLENLLYTWVPTHGYFPNRAVIMRYHDVRNHEDITKSSLCIPIAV